MKFFLDTAHVPHIRQAASAGLVDGITTNPSLLAKEEGSPREVILEITKVVDGPVNAEVVSFDTEGMVREGLEWRKLADNIVVKIPMTLEGLKAIRTLSERNVPTNCTLIFTPMQAVMAAKAGASYVSPFVGRIDDIKDGSGMEVVQQIVQIYLNYEFATEVIVASVRNPMHVVDAALMGIERFLADWEKVKNRS
jgi:transaldolase